MAQISYRVIRSARRTLAIQIGADGQVVIRSPYDVPDSRIAELVKTKSGWIIKHRDRRLTLEPTFTSAQIHELAERALQQIPGRVKYFAPLVGVTYGSITIRNQKTRWGSCTSEGNLNFNCILMLAPPRVLDYVVVHELCHRKEMNHSEKFWTHVARVCPDYKECRKWLKEQGAVLIARMAKYKSL